jgi:hypothetical protein
MMNATVTMAIDIFMNDDMQLGLVCEDYNRFRQMLYFW